MLKKILLSVLLPCLVGCGYSQEKGELSGEYDLAQPEVFRLPGSLFEVSGIALRAGRADTVYAIQDEDGSVFRMTWNEREGQRTRFAGKGDYEDIALLGDQFIVLKSDGTLYTFPFLEINKKETDAQKWDELLPKGEYEGIFGDEKSGELYVLCKNCPRDKSKKEVSGFVLNPEDDMEEVGEFRIDIGQIRAITKNKKQTFYPSALARQPGSGAWYLLSSADRLLVVADSRWRIQYAFTLPGNIFTQPEGIAFDRDGTLYISNEGDKISSANILKFKKIR